MSATFSFEKRLERKLAAWEMSLEAFSALALLTGISGASRARLRSAIRGDSLPNTTAVALDSLVQEIERFFAALAPIRPATSNAVELHGWLVAIRTSALRINVESHQ